ncbi:MAG: Holliday junction resolvase RuvX, partial [Clostridia bacterium]|nr:Holliday junction resolvase RuvX [Clostridia bacterium]
MKQLLQTKGKLLGVDFGDKRTGLAISNDMRTLASGITQISVGGMQKTAAAVAQVAKDRAVVGVVVGLPVNMDGSQGFRAERCREFADLLRERLPGVPVAMMDERMTT